MTAGGSVVSEKEWRRMNLEWERRRRDARWAAANERALNDRLTNQRGWAEEEAEGRGGAQTQDGAQTEEQGRGGGQTKGEACQGFLNHLTSLILGTSLIFYRHGNRNETLWLFIFTIIIPNDQVEERRRRERENMAGLREALGSQNRNSDNIDVEVRKMMLWW